jgi:hypothetical protein
MVTGMEARTWSVPIDPMLLILICFVWLTTVALVLALCSVAAQSEGDGVPDSDELALPTLRTLDVIRDRGDTADAAHGARGHFPSGVLAPPSGFA